MTYDDRIKHYIFQKIGKTALSLHVFEFYKMHRCDLKEIDAIVEFIRWDMRCRTR